MNLPSLRKTGLALAACAAWSAGARAQCPDWEAIGPLPGSNGLVYATAVFDSGTGPELYVGGTFTEIAGHTVQRIARWDGTSWSSVGGGFPASSEKVEVMRVFNLGDGPALYVGGKFFSAGGIQTEGVAKWDGTAWQTLGSGVGGISSHHEVHALEVVDLGSGRALYVGGDFDRAGGVSAINLAKWDGSNWSSIGDSTGQVEALVAYDDGTGTQLYATGWFGTIGGVGAGHIARYDGNSWSTFGSLLGTGDHGRSLAVMDDGSGPALFVGGRFNSAGGVFALNIARWDGSGWSSLGTNGVNSSSASPDVVSMIEFDDGSGPALYVGGQITSAGPHAAKGVARWDGSDWSTLGAGVEGRVNALAALDDGNGPRLWAGGSFDEAGSVGSQNLAIWDGLDWEGVGGGFDYIVRDLALHDDGSGPLLYACGSFEIAGGAPARFVARRGPSGWESIGFPWGPGTTTYINTLEAVASYDDGTGAKLYVGGGEYDDGRVFEWDGVSWVNLVHLDGQVQDLAVHDDGTGAQLYACGYFDQMFGSSANRVVRFDGNGWTTVGSGLIGQTHAMAVWDDGTGPALYAGGFFKKTGGGTNAWHVARWDGTAWGALIDPGLGFPGTDDWVYSLGVHDDGTGAALYVGGRFAGAGPLVVNGVARWDGTTWSALGSGVGGAGYEVNEFATYDDGTGSKLFVGGEFTTAGGAPTEHLATWDGANWGALPAMDGFQVYGLQPFVDGGEVELAVGGRFTAVGGAASANFAIWDGCADANVAVAYCAGDGGTLACPCGNQSAGGANEGCVNSTGVGGRLSAGGTASVTADDLLLEVSQIAPGMPGIIAAGIDKGAAPFGDGLLCVTPPVERFPVAFADPGGTFQVGGIASFLGLSAGQTRTFQGWYRDPGGPCAATFNLTGALSIVFTP